MPLIPMPALETPPHIVLLMIGTHDIAQNDDLANAQKRLGALLDNTAISALLRQRYGHEVINGD